jgi:hypothetical protein
MPFARRLFFVVTLIAASWSPWSPSVAADQGFEIFVAPTGDDGANGSSASKPVKSLGRALRLYDADCASRATRIRLAAGTYGDEKITIKRLPCPLSIDGGGGGERATFDGKGEGTWLQVATPGAHQVDLTIRGLTISNYATAISLNGNRDDAQAWFGGVKIIGNKFVRIGAFDDKQKPSTAAIRLVNSRMNLIEGNEFMTIRNVKQCGGLHAIYIAHMSSENRIVGNTFVDGCGDTIKVRDASSRNVVEKNSFSRQEGHSLMLDSYCDSRSGATCTKDAGECPSFDNIFRNNTLIGAPPASKKNVVVARKPLEQLPATCPVQPKSAPRIVEQGSSAR